MGENNNQSDIPKKRSKIIPILIVVTLVILSSAFYIFYRASQEPVPVLKAVIVVNGTTSEPGLESITLIQEEIPQTEEPKESGSHFPGIYLIAYGPSIESDYSQPYTKWTSKTFSGPGTYTLTASFLFEPKSGDNLRIQVRILNGAADTIAGEEKTMVWE
jgi:hypothetical protein